MSRREGTFEYSEEFLTVRKINDGTEFHGMFEVTDAQDFRISCAFTSKLAIRNAMDEIDYIAWHMERFLRELFGECPGVEGQTPSAHALWGCENCNSVDHLIDDEGGEA